MPGILPMKVIQIGNSTQSRIAQACDRCRSKKIRCDGMRPCSQCSKVGFECRTSDKLSRRAFPRGYTESLEERVRVLEAEVRELKDLVDEKDEKMELLSKMHSHRQPRSAAPLSSMASSSLTEAGAPAAASEDCFRVQASPLLLGIENADSYLMGGSSGRAFVETFERKLRERGFACGDFHSDNVLHGQGCSPLTATTPTQHLRIPSRLFTDRAVNIFFQEWAPLFPVLHKPTFLRIYEDFLLDPDKIRSQQKLAQLYLVFGIASLSSRDQDMELIAACELQWQRSLEAILGDNSIMTLQCLVLGLMYCTVRADHKRLQHYKAVAVGLAHRLGLHQSQKRFSLGALMMERRKKVFWTLYTLDCFSAAILGLPRLFRDEDVHAEYPSDTDDQGLTEKSFQPSWPGEHTQLSAGLELFRGARVLARVLSRNYPAAASHELCLQHMSGLETELDSWRDSLPQHLKLRFTQDRPSTDVTGDRSPMICLVYHYIRILIYRPAVGSALGTKAASAMLAVSESSKRLVQIVQLLDERVMSFSICLNKADTLTLCTMSLLYQNMDLSEPNTKISKDNERLVNAVVKMTAKMKGPCMKVLERVADMLITLDATPQLSATTTTAIPTPRQSPEVMARVGPPHHRTSSANTGMPQVQLRRMTPPETTAPLNCSKPCGRTYPDLLPLRSGDSCDQERGHHVPAPPYRFSPNNSHVHPAQPSITCRPSPTSIEPPSSHASIVRSGTCFLDIMVAASSSSSQPASPAKGSRSTYKAVRKHVQTSQFYRPTDRLPKQRSLQRDDWAFLMGSLDEHLQKVYNAILRGPKSLAVTNDKSEAQEEEDWTVATARSRPSRLDLWNSSSGGGGCPSEQHDHSRSFHDHQSNHHAQRSTPISTTSLASLDDYLCDHACQALFHNIGGLEDVKYSGGGRSIMQQQQQHHHTIGHNNLANYARAESRLDDLLSSSSFSSNDSAPSWDLSFFAGTIGNAGGEDGRGCDGSDTDGPSAAIRCGCGGASEGNCVVVSSSFATGALGALTGLRDATGSSNSERVSYLSSYQLGEVQGLFLGNESHNNGCDGGALNGPVGLDVYTFPSFFA